jgi:hypothetical protein
MRAILFVLVGIGLNSAANAAVDANVYIGTETQCGARLGAVVRHSQVTLPIRQEVYQLARKALRHYRDELTRGGVYIASATAYKDLAHGSIAGYRVTITDGGDESTVAYLFDGKGKLLYGKWENQSPETYWFCEK